MMTASTSKRNLLAQNNIRLLILFIPVVFAIRLSSFYSVTDISTLFDNYISYTEHSIILFNVIICYFINSYVRQLGHYGALQ